MSACTKAFVQKKISLHTYTLCPMLVDFDN